MSIVGIDIGNDNCVVAVVKPKAIHILLNDESKYETPSVVSFVKKKRQIGSSGTSSSTLNSKSTISQLKRLIGRRFDDLNMNNELPFLPFGIVEAPDGGILIQVNYLNEDREFTPVQILAMLLSNLKQMSERNLDMPISNCVIGVPSYFTDRQRISYLDAAKIAGLNPLKFIHDGTAIALGYGIYKTDIVGNPIYVVFVDVGNSDTQVTVASFHVEGVRILSHASNQNLGGRDFDRIIFDYFADEFKEQYKVDVSRNARARLRLMTACEKLKRVLTANAEAHITIECLMDDKDLYGTIRREDFEELSVDLLEEIIVVCERALADAGLTVYDINSVELVGSGSRVPAISRILTEVFRREPSRTLNASECVARGCALQCTMLSPNSRIKKYLVQDSIPYPIWFLGKSSDILMLPRGHNIPQVVVLTFRRKTRPFLLHVLCDDQNELPEHSAHGVRCFKVGPFKVRKNEVANVEVKIRVNVNGTVTVECASLNKGRLVDGQVHTGSKTIRVKEVSPIEMTKDEIFEAQSNEKELADHDASVEETQRRKNDLEGFVYDLRKKLAGKFKNFATAPEKETISTILTEIEEWLYEDSDDESEDVYSSQFDKLHELVNQIENRYVNEVYSEPTKYCSTCAVDSLLDISSIRIHQI